MCRSRECFTSPTTRSQQTRVRGLVQLVTKSQLQMAEEVPVSYESKRCNVLLLGSGKSTLANKILRHDNFKTDSQKTAESVTDAVSSWERVIEGPGKVMYSVKIIDTMGFSDPARDSDDTVKEIARFFRDEVVEGVSLVLFVMKKGRVTVEVVDMVNLIEKHFKEISAMSALVITHCETLTDEVRERIVDEYKTSREPAVITMYKFMQQGIYAVGFPDLEVTMDAVKPVYKQGMEADVKKIHEVIYNCTEMKLTSEMFFGEKFWKRVKQSAVTIRPTVDHSGVNQQAEHDPSEAKSNSWCVIS